MNAQSISCHFLARKKRGFLKANCIQMCHLLPFFVVVGTANCGGGGGSDIDDDCG